MNSEEQTSRAAHGVETSGNSPSEVTVTRYLPVMYMEVLDEQREAVNGK